MTTNVLPFDDHSTIQAQAREWLIRLDRDESPSQQQIEELHAWMAQSPAHRAELTRISEFWDDANILNELSTPVYDQNGFSLVRFLQPLLGRWGFGNLWPRANAFTAVASIAVITAVVMIFNLIPAASNSTNGIYVSAIGELQERKLVDGSVIQINTDSQVQVDFSDNVRKIRLLRGEAHFEVAANKDWPFEVYAGKGMVKAVGTAFAVRLNNGTIKVTVSHGRVDLASAVETQSNAQPLQLQKIASLAIAQSATFKNSAIQVNGETDNTVDSQQLASDSAEKQIHSISNLQEDELARTLSWRTGYLVFSGDPLIDVVNEINRYTPVSVEIGDLELQQLRVGGRFKVGELNAMLDVLETSFGIQVNRLDGQRIQLH